MSTTWSSATTAIATHCCRSLQPVRNGSCGSTPGVDEAGRERLLWRKTKIANLRRGSDDFTGIGYGGTFQAVLMYSRESPPPTAPPEKTRLQPTHPTHRRHSIRSKGFGGVGSRNRASGRELASAGQGGSAGAWPYPHGAPNRGRGGRLGEEVAPTP